MHYNSVKSLSQAILGDISKGTSYCKVRLTFHPYIQIYTAYCNSTCFNAFSTERFLSIAHLFSGQLQKHWFRTFCTMISLAEVPQPLFIKSKSVFVSIITPWTVFQDGINEYYFSFICCLTFYTISITTNLYRSLFNNKLCHF